MTIELDETHDPDARSWIDAANRPGADFPLQNLPFGVFRHGSGAWRIGVAIGDQLFDLAAAVATGLLDPLDDRVRLACRLSRLNGLMSLGPAAWTALRRRLHALLRAGSRQADEARETTSRCLVDLAEVELALPVDIGDYTDFYASIHHATNVGRMLRPDQPLLPNYKWVPIAYHGRASSVVVSGTPIRRPRGQVRAENADAPAVIPTRALDYELEVGAYIGVGNDLGVPIPIDEADGRIFGVCLLNDWSARDVQAWEYQPLGPFLSKSFATTVSPWVVTLDALRPYRVPRPPRPEGDPPPLPYLDGPDDRAAGALALVLEVWLSTAGMRARGLPPHRVSQGRFRDMYWTFAQMVAHHSSNGCNLRTGDLIGSGTVSGPEEHSRGCLLELAWRGTAPIVLPSGERRAFLEDGDEVVFRGRAEAPGHPGIGFGECRGCVVS